MKLSSKLSLSLCLPLVLFAVGCGPAGQQFHGEYTGSNLLTVSVNAGGGWSDSGPMAFRIAEGVDSDIVLVNSNGACSWPANVEGNVATIKGGSTCTATAQGLTVTATVTHGSVVLTGKAIQVSISGTMVISANGQTYPATYVQNPTLTRIGK